MRQGLGILGGMGPLASAEFITTIYEYSCASLEQEMPRCILYSDPTIPDRTEAIRHNQPDPVVNHLQHALTQLARHDVARIVMTCITAHYFLPYIPPELRAQMISLVDIILDSVVSAQVPYLMFCTNGTRQVEIFQHASRWSEAAPFIVLPADDDQHAIHQLLYRVKQGESGPERLADVEQLLAKYHVRGLIAGCTEMHLLTKQLAARGGYQIADPLLTIAQTLPHLLASGVCERAVRAA